MYCPYCKHTDSRVVDSRTTDDGAAIRRRRQCTACSRRFTTVETTTISVIKRSGVTEPFDRSKIAAGVRKACQGVRWAKTIWQNLLKKSKNLFGPRTRRN